MTKWYERRPFCELMIDRSSLYSVIIASSADDFVSCASPEHENSKIALPTTESATCAYRVMRFLMEMRFVLRQRNQRVRTVVVTPAAVPQVTV